MVNYTAYSLLEHNTFGINVRCRSFYQFDSKKELKELWGNGLFKEKWLVVGGGSNLLLMNDLDYPVLHSGMTEIGLERETGEEIFVRADAGVCWDDFVAYTVEKNWAGLENLSYIPGTVGAAPVQNVGAYGVEAKDLVYEVEVFDTQTGTFQTMRNEQCLFGYRDSFFKRNHSFIVVSVVFKLSTSADYKFKLDYGNIREVVDAGGKTIGGVRQAIISIRRSKLPEVGEVGSAGSFFKNPVVPKSVYEDIERMYDVPVYEVDECRRKIPAAWLISQCGWKGKSMGKAGVYEKQPLILVNRGGASGSDVLQLMKAIQSSVKQKFGIELQPEVCIVE